MYLSWYHGTFGTAQAMKWKIMSGCFLLAWPQLFIQWQHFWVILNPVWKLLLPLATAMYEMTWLPSKLKSYLKMWHCGFISSLLDEMKQFLSKIPFRYLWQQSLYSQRQKPWICYCASVLFPDHYSHKSGLGIRLTNNFPKKGQRIIINIVS